MTTAIARPVYATRADALTRAALADVHLFGAAIHESGHCLAAVLAGGRVTEASVHPGPVSRRQPVAGRTGWRDVPDDMQAAVLFAGSWAEARWTCGPDPSPVAITAALERNVSDHRQLIACGHWDYREDDPLLEPVWPAVLRLADELFTRGTIDHHDVIRMLVDCV